MLVTVTGSDDGLSGGFYVSYAGHRHAEPIRCCNVHDVDPCRGAALGHGRLWGFTQFRVADPFDEDDSPPTRKRGPLPLERDWKTRRMLAALQKARGSIQKKSPGLPTCHGGLMADDCVSKNLAFQ